MEKTLKFLLLLTLTFLIFLLPLFNIPIFQYPFDFSPYILTLIFGSVLLVLLGILTFMQKQIVLPEKVVGFPLLGFIAAYAVSTIFSLSPVTSFFGIYGFYAGSFIVLFFAVVVYLSVLMLKNEKALILKSLVLAGVAVSVFGIWGYITNFISTKELVFRITSTLGQPNRLSFFLLPLIPLSFWEWTAVKDKNEKIFYGISSWILLVGLLLTFTRTAYLVVLLLGVISFFFTPLRKKAQKAVPTLTILMIVFGIVLLGSVPYVLKNFQMSSPGLRLAELQGSIEVVVDRPLIQSLIGYGPETTFLTFFKHRSAIYNSNPAEKNAGPPALRNQYLQYLGIIGVIGLVFYLYFVC